MNDTCLSYSFPDEPVKQSQFQPEDGYYEYPPEIWDAKKCAKAAKHWHRDGYGTKHHRPGYIGCSTSIGGYGRTRYNGGTIINDEWYKGIIRHLPKVAEGYKIVQVLTWGFYIVKA